LTADNEKKNYKKGINNMAKTEIEIILNFVSGDMNMKDFENELYTNSKLEEVLRDPSLNWSGTYISNIATNIYDYLICLNYSRAEGRLDAVEAVKLFLDAQKISYTETKEYQKLFDLLLSTQPKYLDIDSQFFEKYILPKDFKGSQPELKQIIKNNFNKYFRFQTKPPKWLQNPQWIIKDDKPLFFLGQLDIKHKIFHDNGVVYVFMDDRGEIETIKQFY
jgi:hypothetical protein